MVLETFNIRALAVIASLLLVSCCWTVRSTAQDELSSRRDDVAASNPSFESPVAEYVLQEPLDAPGDTSPRPTPSIEPEAEAESDTSASLRIPTTPTRFRRSRVRLARAPNVFGDFFSGGTIAAQTNFNFVTADLPLAGGSRRVKVAEHNKALPDDRVFFVYNHFHNALEVARAPAPFAPPFAVTSFPVDRYTVGVEKSFACGDWSVEMRMPFTSQFGIADTSPAFPFAPDFVLAGGKFGDLAIILKRLLYLDDYLAVSGGLGINTPTGSDARGALPILFPPIAYEVENQAVHFLPYVGFLSDPDNRFYFHGFAQLDVAANGNRVTMVNGFGNVATGRLNDQTLLYLDFSAGYRLYQNACACYLTGVAVSAEFHYTSTLQDADLVPLLGGFGVFGPTDNRYDVLNTTIGLDLQFAGDTNLRVAGAFPVDDAPENRFFDSEIQAALIRRF